MNYDICYMYINIYIYTQRYTRVVSPTLRCFKVCFFAIKLVFRQGLTDFRQLGEAEALLFTAGKHLGAWAELGSQKVSETGHDYPDQHP